MRRKILIAATAIVLILLVGGGATAGVLFLRTPEPGDTVQVMIPAGRSTAAIGEQLVEEGVISSDLGFRLFARLQGMDGRIQAGRYELRRNLGVRAALEALEAGPRDEHIALTVPEGYTVRQIAARVGERTHISVDAFLEAAESGDIRSSIQPPDVDSLEGFLFPDTYMIHERETAEGLVRRMVALFDQRAAELDISRAQTLGMTPYEAVIAASLIEREARINEDRDKVSAVIHNRLERGMRLQIDATILYTLPEHKVPTRQDLRIDSPYNTYLYEGFPPTPIANPGREALRAALEPADITALFYVVVDPSGRHHFSDTYEEHLRMMDRRPPETTGRRQ